jgi:GAF domain-containing protein
MSSNDPSSVSAIGLELLLERLGTGLGAERVLLEPAGAVTALEDGRVLHAPMRLADGSPGILLAQRGATSPVFDTTERRLFQQLASIAETVLTVAGDATRRSQALAITRAIAGTAGPGTVAETLALAVDAVFERSAYQEVAATLIDREAGEQVTVADRSHSLSNRTGMRKPIGDGPVGIVAGSGEQLLLGPEPATGDRLPRNSTLLTPVLFDGVCAAVLELYDTRPGQFGAGDSELMGAVAAQLGASLSAVRMHEESMHRSARLSTGSAVAAALSSAVTHEQALELATRTVFDESRYHVVAATIVLEESEEQLLVSDLTRDGGPTDRHRRPLEAGLVGSALTSQRQLLLGDAQSDPRFHWPTPMNLRSLLVTPVVVDGRSVAALELWDAHSDRFDRFDAALMQHVADHLAAAWRSIDLREQSERRARRLELALEVTRGVAEATSPEGALASAVDALARSTTFRAMAAVLADHSAGEQMLVAGRTPDGPLDVGLRRAIGEGLTGQVIGSGEPLLVADSDAGGERRPWMSEPDFRSMLIMPVMVSGVCAATLELGDERANVFGDGDLVLMATAAEQVSAALLRIGLSHQSAQRAGRLALVAELAHAIVQSGTVEEALDVVAHTIFAKASYSATLSALALPETGEHLIVSDYNASGTSLAGVRRPLGIGLIGEVFATGVPLMLGHALDDPRYTWSGPASAQSLLLVPVLEEGRCRALLGVYENDPDQLDASDLSLMTAVAGQVGASLRGVELRDQSERRASRLALTAQIAGAIASVRSVDEALERSAEQISSSTDYETVSVIRCIHERGEAVMPISLDRINTRFEPRTWPIDAGITARTISTCRPVRLGRATSDPDYSWPGPLHYESLIQVPVVVSGRCEAVIELAAGPANAFNDDDLALLTTVAEQVAAAIRGAQLRAESESRAQRLAVTLEAARAVAAADSPEAVLETFVRTVFDGVGYTAVEASMPLEDDRQVIVASLNRDGSSHRGVIRPSGDGTTGVALTEGRQVTMDDMPETEVIPGLIAGPSWRSRLATPVIISGEVVAVLNVGEPRPHAFDDADRLFMQTVAEQVAAALRGAWLRDQSQRRAERLSMALEIAETASGSGTVESTLRSAALVIKRLVKCDSVAGFVALRDSGEQLGLVDSDVGEDSVEGMRRPIAEGYTGRAFAGTDQILIGHGAPTADPDDPWLPAVWGKYESVLLTPIVSEGTTDALIVLYDSRPDRFDEDDAVLMRTVAEQLAAALRGARLRDESDRRAERLAVTLDVAGAVAAADSVDDALRAAASQVFHATTYAAVTAILIDGEQGEEIVVADEVRAGGNIIGMRRPLTARGTGLAAVSGEAVLFEHAGRDPDYVAWGDNGFESAVAAPVMLDGICVASLVVYGQHPRAFDEQDVVLMRTVAEQVAAALRGLRLRDQSEARAQRLEQLELRHRALLERLVRAQEQERSRVAADLHDDTVQVLSACVIALDRVRRSIEQGETERAAATLTEVSQLIAEAVDRTRRMTFELRPAVLWHHGLEAALKQLIGTVESETGIAARLEVSTPAVRLDATLETIAFRSIAELVANARSHSGAKTLTVTLGYNREQLHAVVEDDGRGFDVDLARTRARATNHLGLEALVERVDAAGGEVTVGSTPGVGTRVTLRLPTRSVSPT